jgi:hypothetical protein
MTAVGAGAAAGLAAGAARAAVLPAVPLYKVVADARFAEGLAFGAEAERLGRTVAWIRGDVTALWYDELDLLWRRDKAALVGLTEPAAFFCLERLALDRGLRVVFKGEHRQADGLAVHRLSGPKAVVTPSALHALSEHAWPSQTAHLALAALGAGAQGARLQTTAAAADRQPALLISWTLAPKPERRA